MGFLSTFRLQSYLAYMSWDSSLLRSHGSSSGNTSEKLQSMQDQAQAALSTSAFPLRNLQPRLHAPLTPGGLMPLPQDETERDIWQGYNHAERLPASGLSQGLDCPIRASPGGSKKCGYVKSHLFDISPSLSTLGQQASRRAPDQQLSHCLRH